MKRGGSAYWGSLFVVIVLPALCHGAVKGLCSDCHTMHNSQQGRRSPSLATKAGSRYAPRRLSTNC